MNLKLRLKNNLLDEFILFGTNAETHNKNNIFGSNKFSDVVKKIKNNSNQKISIGLTRYNFFKLGQIIDFVNSLKGINTEFSPIKMKLFPVSKLKTNFNKYLNYFKNRQNNIEIIIVDEKLIQLLDVISSRSKNEKYKDRELIRYLGLVCEYAFIGPEQIVIDPYHRCNTNCVHCWNHSPFVDPGLDWKKLMLDLDFFKKLIDDASNLKVDHLVFGGAGEPLMHPQILDIFEYASIKGLQVIVSTNAINLTKKFTDKLLKLNIKEVICSLPAASTPTYNKINPMHKGKNTFSKIVKNLLYFASQKKILNKNITLSMYHVIHNQNYHEIPKMARMDVDIGVDIARFSLIRLQKEFMHLKLNSNHMASIKNSVKFVEAYFSDKKTMLRNNIHFQIDNFNPSTGEWSGKILNKWGCKLGWFFSLLLADKTLSLCCHVREIDNLGNIDFTDSWRSTDYNKYRVHAKYMKNHQDTKFKNGIKLYDDKCENCDNHVTLIKIEEKIKEFGLSSFIE